MGEESVTSSYDLPTGPPPTVSTVVGKTRPLASLQQNELIFVAVSIINILATVVLTIDRLVTLIVQNNQASPDFTFAILLLINSAFCTFYVVHGVLRERQFELVAFVAAILVVLGYCVIEYSINYSGRNTVKLVRLIFGCVVAPANIYLAFQVAKEFGFLSFRIVGASEVLQGLYNQAAAFSCLLKFDLQVSLSFIILALQEGTNIMLGEMITLIIGIPYTILYTILGTYTMRKELRRGMWIFGVLSLPGIAYTIFKFYEVYNNLNRHCQGAAALLTYAPLVAGAIYLVVHAVLMCEAVVVYQGFDQGLKEAAFTDQPDERTSLLAGVRVKRDPSRNR